MFNNHVFVNGYWVDNYDCCTLEYERDKMEFGFIYLYMLEIEFHCRKAWKHGFLFGILGIYQPSNFSHTESYGVLMKNYTLMIFFQGERMVSEMPH